MSEQKDFSQYDELAAKHNAAYDAFISMYEMRNPKPEKVRVKRDHWFIPVMLLAIMVASVIVSSSRTVDEFGGGGVGYSAVLMLEFAVIAFAFFRTRFGFTEERLDEVKVLARRGLILAITVAVAANIDDTLSDKGVVIADWIEAIIKLLLAISAPTLAFISGDMLAIVTMSNTTHQRRAEKEDRENLKAWQDAANASWNSQKSRWGITVNVDKPTPSSMESDVNLRKFTSIDRPSPKMKVALQWLRDHPEHLETESRELAKLIGVSHTLANDARKVVKSELNGHGGHN